MAQEKEEKVTEGEVVEEKKNDGQEVKRNKDGRLFLGIIFLFLGALTFINNFYPAIDVSKYFWPAILIILGVAMVVRSL